MSTGLKRSILIIVVSVTVLPWGAMQPVQSALVKGVQSITQGPDQLINLRP
jgi:hypothetical protein